MLFKKQLLNYEDGLGRTWKRINGSIRLQSVASLQFIFGEEYSKLKDIIRGLPRYYSGEYHTYIYPKQMYTPANGDFLMTYDQYGQPEVDYWLDNIGFTLLLFELGADDESLIRQLSSFVGVVDDVQFNNIRNTYLNTRYSMAVANARQCYLNTYERFKYVIGHRWERYDYADKLDTTIDLQLYGNNTVAICNKCNLTDVDLYNHASLDALLIKTDMLNRVTDMVSGDYRSFDDFKKEVISMSRYYSERNSYNIFFNKDVDNDATVRYFNSIIFDNRI